MIEKIRNLLTNYYREFSTISPNGRPEYKLYLEFYSIFEYIFENKSKINNDDSKLLEFIDFINNLLDNYSNAGADEVVKFFDKFSKIIKSCNGDIYNYLSNCDINSAGELSFNYILKSNLVSEIIKSKIDYDLRDKLINDYGKHFAYVFEYAGYLNVVNCNTYRLNLIDEDFLTKIEKMKEYIDVNENKDRIKIKDSKINELRKYLIQCRWKLGYKSGGFSYGTNNYEYNDEICTFDYMFRSYKDDNIVKQRKIFYDIVNEQIKPSDDIVCKILYSNYACVQDILEFGFSFTYNRVLTFTKKLNFSGCCYDVLLYIIAKKKELTADTLKMSGSYGWIDNEFIIGNDVYKPSSEFGTYVVNGVDKKIYDENFSI